MMDLKPDYSIAELDSASPHIATVARWLFEAWGKSQSHDLSETTAWCKHLADAKDETIIVATRDDRPIGTLALVQCDLAGHGHFRPWLSSFYLLPAERGKSIGYALVQAARGWVREMGYSNLYLYARRGRLTAYYRRLGWQPVEDLVQHGQTFEIMRNPLS